MHPELQKIALDFLKNDAMLALGTLLMALAVNLFTIGEYVFSLLFFLCAGISFMLRVANKTDREIERRGLNVAKLNRADAIAKKRKKSVTIITPDDEI